MKPVIARTTLGRSFALALCVAVSNAAAPAAQAASGHLVDSRHVVERLIRNARTREEKVKLFQDALATAQARRQAAALGVSAARLARAVPHLSDRELADLSQRATRARDVAAGHGSNDGMVILGLVLLLAGLAVLVAVSDYGEHYDDCYCY
jgi:hypothetical protein